MVSSALNWPLRWSYARHQDGEPLRFPTPHKKVDHRKPIVTEGPWRDIEARLRAHGALEELLRNQSVTLSVARNVGAVFMSARVMSVSPAIGPWLFQARVEGDPGLDRYEKELREFLRHIQGVMTTPAPSEGQFELAFTETGMPGATPADRWSSGTRHLALILLGLAALPEGSIMMIEEPELSLHPYAIRCLREKIHESAGEGRIQFFITTHSPYIAEAIDPEMKAHTLWQFSRAEDGSAEVTACKMDQEVADAIDSLKVGASGSE